MDQPHDDYLDPADFEPIESPVPSARPRILIPVLLFVATCIVTWREVDAAYALCIMTILLAHEFGHFLQAVRYKIPASLPYFLPMPGSPIGTMGAVIVMQPGMGNRRSLFDIGISGPIAGLIPSILFTIIGLQWSQFQPIQPITPDAEVLQLGAPILFRFLANATLGPTPEGSYIAIHSVAFAGWVGIFLTALNLFPIGQLDGGHVLYALLLRRAHRVARALLMAVMFAVVLWGYWGWSLMILLLMLMGPIHPPTANDEVPLGVGRTILGWAALLFVPLGFTPVPFSFPM